MTDFENNASIPKIVNDLPDVNMYSKDTYQVYEDGYMVYFKKTAIKSLTGPSTTYWECVDEQKINIE